VGVRLTAVGKRYGIRQPWVVRDVSLEVAPGRLIRLEGRNGSGKSTLLKVVAGVSLPSAGRIFGRPHAGYVPERFPGGLPFPARDYLLHMARVHGLRGPAGAAAVDEWLERLGACGYASTALRTLSKGMCQKVAIAQALLARPALLVLDEAWTGLDQAARGTLDLAVAERVAAGAIVLFVDHDPARLAGQASERWQLGSGGRLTVAPGDPALPPGPPGPAGGAVVVIEVDGLEPESARQARDLPGVLGCDRSAVRVAAGQSDDVLRTVLSWDGVHVRAVHAEVPGAEVPSAEIAAAGRPGDEGAAR
jgi:ABC-type Mn2+/Zn2+ transport system ATPase subunit